MTFKKREITVTFGLGLGPYGTDNEERIELRGHRVSCDIVNVRGPGMGQAEMLIYGLSPDLYRHLASLGRASKDVRRTRLIIDAGDAGETSSRVFEGQVSLSQLEMNRMPEVCLRVMAHSGLFEAVTVAPPTSYRTDASAATILYNLAQKMGIAFENNGVTAMLSRPYLKGSLRDQVQACAEMAGIEWTIEDAVLAIWPKGGSRGGLVPLVSPRTGMVGYPTFFTDAKASGIDVRTQFTTSIRNGGDVKVESELEMATGYWTTWLVAYELDAEVPDGHWFTRFRAYGAPRKA